MAIKIMTYNISWEMMTASAAGGFDATFCNSNGVNKCREEAIKLILQENPDILALQEYPDSIVANLRSAEGGRDYEEISTTSGPERMLSVYDRKKFKLHKRATCDEFAVGRPYIIIELIDKKSRQRLVVANIHCGHAVDASEDCILKKKFLDALSGFIPKGRKKTSPPPHIIIVGDNNRDYSKHYSPLPAKEKLLGITFYLDTETANTCCYKFDALGVVLKTPQRKYDWMLYNRGQIKSRTVVSAHPTSDHLPLVGSITV